MLLYLFDLNEKYRGTRAEWVRASALSHSEWTVPSSNPAWDFKWTIFSVERKDLQALTLVRPTMENVALDPRDVQQLNIRLHGMIKVFKYYALQDKQIQAKNVVSSPMCCLWLKQICKCRATVMKVVLFVAQSWKFKIFIFICCSARRSKRSYVDLKTVLLDCCLKPAKLKEKR